MNKKEIIALIRSDIKKHMQGEISNMPTVNQYAANANLAIGAFEKLLSGLTEEEQAYCYSREKNEED